MKNICSICKRISLTDLIACTLVDHAYCFFGGNGTTNQSRMIVCSLAVFLLLEDVIGYAHSSTAETGESSLLQRMESLESLVLEQDVQLKLQESKFLQQLTHQTQRLSSLQSLLRRQHAKLSQQEKQLRWQKTKLSQQDELLSQLCMLHLTNCKQTDSLCKEMRQSYRLEKCKQGQTDSNVEAADSGRLPSKNITLTLDPLKDPPLSEQTSSYDVKARASDAGPLDAVVGGLSQQVTDMNADIRAWKTQTEADLQTLQTSILQQDHDIQDAASSIFVRWGSSQCGSSSQLVYSGVVGGSWYDHTGAASNYLCLTMSPVFSTHPSPSYSAYLYGAEYQTLDSHHNKNPVCAVCRSTLSTTVMIPGTNVCTAGWSLQYSGFLMAGRYDRAAASQYICVDSGLENTVHGDQNEDGRVLYYTVTRCGSLPCSPYVNDKVVTCAVCSKWCKVALGKFCVGLRWLRCFLCTSNGIYPYRLDWLLN